MSNHENKGVLEGLKVVHSSKEIAGPFGPQIMAEWGADVIWIENTFGGDSNRYYSGGLVSEQERRNERSIALNTFTEEGRKIFFEIIKDADIFLESGKGNVKGDAYSRHGMSDEELWEVNPRLVIVHLSGFGLYGDPKVYTKTCYDIIAQSYSGVLNANGYMDRAPMSLRPGVGDYVPGLFAGFSALAAVFRARQTGKGESIDLSMVDVWLRLQSYTLNEYLNRGVELTRNGDFDPVAVGFGTYKAADGYVSLGALGAKQVKAVLTAIGLEELIGSETFPDGAIDIEYGMPKAEFVHERIVEWMSKNTCQDILDELEPYDVPISKVFTYPEIAEMEHYKLRDLFIEYPTSEGEMYKAVNIVPKFKNNPTHVWRGLAKYGEDNGDILSKAGFSEEEISGFYENGTITDYQHYEG